MKEEIKKIKKTNIDSLQRIDNFLNDIDFNNTIFEYGAPAIVKQNINYISNKISYTELICLLIQRYLDEPKYLEFGCSFGKNFWQITNYFKNGNFYACDLENPNPSVFKNFDKKNEINLGKDLFFDKEIKSTFTEYQFDNKKIFYLIGNLLEPKTYDSLKKQKFNFIFSDAYHDPIGIRAEIDNLLINDLLDKKFIIYYDDMNFDEEFKICKNKLENHFKQNIYDYKFQIFGWLFEKEPMHNNGILSNINLDFSF